jgi:hypothetical protein
VTKDSGHSDGTGGGKQPPSKNSGPAPNAARRNNVLPIDRGRGLGRKVWPISAAGISLNSGAGLLVVIGVLCGLLISESDRKSPFVAHKPEVPAPAQTGANAPAAGSTAKLAKPSPAIRMETVEAANPAPAKGPASRTPTRNLSYTPAKFQATHKKIFGGCTGELDLTSTGLHFRCPKQADLDFPINAIATANKDGVLLKSGEKYHFAIANRTKDQAEAIFITWLSRVQPGAQQNGAF